MFFKNFWMKIKNCLQKGRRRRDSIKNRTSETLGLLTSKANEDKSLIHQFQPELLDANRNKNVKIKMKKVYNLVIEKGIYQVNVQPKHRTYVEYIDEEVARLQNQYNILKELRDKTMRSSEFAIANPYYSTIQKCIKYAEKKNDPHNFIIFNQDLIVKLVTIFSHENPKTKEGKILVKDYWSLEGTNWVKGGIIQEFTKLLNQRRLDPKYPSTFFNDNYFYTKCSFYENNKSKIFNDTQNMEAISKAEFVFIPINKDQNHWRFYMIDMKNYKLILFDSLNISSTEEVELILPFLNDLLIKLNLPHQNFEILKGISPLQENSNDCGVFTCMSMDYLSRNMPLNYTQKDIPYFRLLIAASLLSGELLTN